MHVFVTLHMSGAVDTRIPCVVNLAEQPQHKCEGTRGK